jgi:hypothetical protein
MRATDADSPTSHPRNDVGQGIVSRADVHIAPMNTATNVTTNMLMKGTMLGGSQPGERRRTILALVSASIISLVVWGLIVALKIQ